jgi:hypothetical protein
MTHTETHANHHAGGCHCGAVRFEVDLDLNAPMLECNCSICSKTGTRLAFVGADKFKLKSGEEHLKDYLFNKKQIHHLFCTTCGIRSFARGATPDGGQMFAVNVRCLDDVDLDAMQVKHHDGKNS